MKNTKLNELAKRVSFLRATEELYKQGYYKKTQEEIKQIHEEYIKAFEEYWTEKNKNKKYLKTR